MNSNLPPGCRVSDIPGNRPEELAMEAAEQSAIEELGKICHSPADYANAVALAQLFLPVMQRIERDSYSEGHNVGYQEGYDAGCATSDGGDLK